MGPVEVGGRRIDLGQTAETSAKRRLFNYGGHHVLRIVQLAEPSECYAKVQVDSVPEAVGR